MSDEAGRGSNGQFAKETGLPSHFGLFMLPMGSLDLRLLMTVHVSRNGQEIGQYTQHDFNSLMQAGRLLPSDYFWVEGMDGWKSDSIAKSFFGQREKCRHCGGKMTEQKPVTTGPRMGQMKSICLKCGHTEYH